jgi:FG-GAP repeat
VRGGLRPEVQSDELGLRLVVDERGARYPLTLDPIAQQAYLKASNTDTDMNAYDEFGISVAVSGDTVVVGAYGESSNATGVNGNQSNNRASLSGAAYVFTGVGIGTSLALAPDGSGSYFLRYAVAPDSSGNVIAVGRTASINFPIRNAMQTINAAVGTAFDSTDRVTGHILEKCIAKLFRQGLACHPRYRHEKPAQSPGGATGFGG